MGFSPESKIWVDPFATNYFVYDGWNLLATLNPALSTLNSFLWGQDLSGTMDKAGGVGGLLAVLENGKAHFTMFDGNGNITGLIKADKTESARYGYSPFGETLTATGPLASANPFRFSTKSHDDESGLVYYGYRYYSSSLGRWISRDPIEENGGRNLFGFAINCPISYLDGLGNAVQSGQAFMLTVQLGIDLALLSPDVGLPLIDANPAVCALMVYWFYTNGHYDFGSPGNDWHLEDFNVPGMGTLKADQFSNFLAGYAGGYASFESGSIFYAASVMGVGRLYDSISEYRKVSDGVSMRWNGLLFGAMDSLDE